MRGFLIGLILGVGLLVAAVIVPQVLRPGAEVDADRAREDAELARRQLHQWNPGIDLLDARADLTALKEADTGALLGTEGARAAIESLQSNFSGQVSAARSIDRNSNLDASGQLQQVDPTSVSQAIEGFERFARENADKWAAAKANASKAGSAGGSVFGVPMIGGMTELAKARQLYGLATRVRTEMRAIQTQAVAAANRLARSRAELVHYRGLDPSETLATLKQDRERMEAELGEVRAEAERLRQTIGERDAELSQLLSQITSTRDQLLSLQSTGFQPGNESSFSGYRSQYRSVSERMRDLQKREHLLRWGGFEQGELDWDALLIQDAEAVVEFDGPVIGHEELTRRLALLEDKIERYESGIGTLNEQADMATAIGASARRRVETYTAAVEQDTEALSSALAQLASLAGEAIEQEDAALSAAQAALSQFQRSSSAAGKLVSDARKTQNEFDPQRLNERLKKQLADQRPEEMATTAQAEANTLIGRLYAERVRGLMGYRDSVAVIRQLGATVAFDEAAHEELLTAARTEGSNSLTAAIEAYTGLAEGGGATAWIFNAAKGSAEYLRGMLNPSEAAAYRANAQAALQAAVDQAGQSPYGRAYVLFLEQLNR